MLAILGERAYARVTWASDFLLNRKHPLVQAFYLLLLTTAVTLFLVLGFPRLTQPHWWWHVRALIPLSIACTYGSFAVASTRDPGGITAHTHARELARFPYDHILYHPDRACRTCQRDKPARSKHCSLCGVCVARADHHCAWINNCVGAGNHVWFLAFLASTTWVCAYGTFLIYWMYVEDGGVGGVPAVGHLVTAHARACSSTHAHSCTLMHTHAHTHTPQHPQL